jgi:hypothetical protein
MTIALLAAPDHEDGLKRFKITTLKLKHRGHTEPAVDATQVMLLSRDQKGAVVDYIISTSCKIDNTALQQHILDMYGLPVSTSNLDALQHEAKTNQRCMRRAVTMDALAQKFPELGKHGAAQVSASQALMESLSQQCLEDERNTFVAKLGTINTTTLDGVPDEVFDILRNSPALNAGRFGGIIVTDRDFRNAADQNLTWDSVVGQRDPVAVGEWLVSVLDDRVEFNADLHGYRRRTHGDDILPSVSLLAEMLSPAYRYDIYRNAEERAFDMERGYDKKKTASRGKWVKRKLDNVGEGGPRGNGGKTEQDAAKALSTRSISRPI